MSFCVRVFKNLDLKTGKIGRYTFKVFLSFFDVRKILRHCVFFSKCYPLLSYCVFLFAFLFRNKMPGN